MIVLDPSKSLERLKFVFVLTIVNPDVPTGIQGDTSKVTKLDQGVVEDVQSCPSKSVDAEMEGQ